MKLENKSPNYSAQVVKIHNLLDAQNSDNLVCFPVNGMNCVLSKGSYEVGEVGVLFPTECQLSYDFCHKNNLHRHSELNEDIESKGYLEDNRRVKALRLRGNYSTALFMSLNSLSYLGIDVSELKEGDSFTHIDNVEVCRKFEIQIPNQKGPKNAVKGKDKVQKVDPKLMPEHHETPQLLRTIAMWNDDDYCFVTAKLHGTSVRLANVLVPKRLSFIERVAKWLGVKIVESEYKPVAGSRRVIKMKSQDDNHYYSTDVYNEALDRVAHLIPKNWVLYGEIIGWSGGSAIQKNYTYQLPQHTNELYIYRISIVNNDGVSCDLTWDQVKEFCVNNGINHVPELERGYFKDIDVEKYMDKSFVEMGFRNCLPLDKGAPCDEGIVVMKYGIHDYFAKVKSPKFLLHETKQLDKGEVDIESMES